MKTFTFRRKKSICSATSSLAGKFQIFARAQQVVMWLVASLLVLVLPVMAAEIPTAKPLIYFDIPAQRADLALIDFAEHADQTLIFSYDITSKAESNRLRGYYTVFEGLQKLLEGSGLFIAPGTDGQWSVIDHSPGEDSLADTAPAKSFLGQVGAAISAAFTSPPNSADDQAGNSDSDESGWRLEVVVVTARKRAEHLHDLPTSAIALGRPLLNDMGVLPDLRSLTDLISGVTINDTNLAFISEPSIRGAGAGRNRMSVSATGLYRNGAYIATGGLGGKNFARMDNYDLERVEVLRGPQGALYGRNALGGSINLITQKPEDEPGAELTIRAGGLNFLGVDTMLNVPVNDRFAFRLSHVNEERDDGHYNDINSNPLDTQDYSHTRISLRHQARDDVEINYVFDTQDQIIPPGIRVRTSLVPLLGGTDLNTFANTLHEMTWDVDNHHLNIDWKLPNGTFTSVSNIRNRFVSARQDGDFYTSAPTRLLQFLQQSDVSSIFFQELRYVSNGTEKLSWLFGLDYFSSSNDDLIDNTLGETTPSAQIRNTHLKQNSWAAFASVDYTLESAPITLSAEARYAVDDINGSLILFRITDLVTPERDFSVKDSYTNLPFSGTISYDLAKINSLAYFKVASSYRQGGINDGPGDPNALFDARLSYGEESSLTYELGWKMTSANNQLSFNFAGFLNNYKDFIAGTDNGCPDQCQLLDADGNPLGFNPDGSRVGEDENGEPLPPNTEIPRTAFLDNVGEADAWGIEAELAYRQPIERTGGSLSLNLGYSRQMGEVEKLNVNVADVFKSRALGARLQYMRPTQWKTQLVYRQPISTLAGAKGFSGVKFVASLNYVYEEGGYLDLNVNRPNPMATAKRLNARIGLQTDTWSLMLNGRNLTDEDYRIWQNAAASVYRRIDPRYIFGEFSYRFQ